MSEKIVLKNGSALAELTTRGAQVHRLALVKEQGREIFLTSGQQAAEGDHVRDGMPLCVPFFGPSPHPSQPQHGEGRRRDWRVVFVTDTAVRLLLDIEPSIVVPALLQVEAFITLEEDNLCIILTIINNSQEQVKISPAFHPYFYTSDVLKTQVEGLNGLNRLDLKTQMVETPVQGAIHLTGAIEQGYPGLSDAHQLRLLTPEGVTEITYTGCTDAVLWNPGTGLPGMSDDVWTQFVCAEGVAKVPLYANGSHKMSCTIRAVS